MMKELELKDAPEVGGGNVSGPHGGCIPDLGYPNWPLAPEPFGSPWPDGSDPDAPPVDPSGL
jgi:hypothetical protein